MPEPADTPPPRAAPRARGRRPQILGVLGGIASGKSAVARALAGERGVVVDADRLAHDVLESAEVRTWLAREVDPALVSPHGVDRAALARVVFTNPALRRELESRVHPRVRERIAAEIAAATERGAPRVVLDVPLLLENDAQHGLARACDALVFVDSDARVRAERAVQARGWASDELARREATQLPLESKRARADVVIANDGDLAQLAERAERALRELERRFEERGGSHTPAAP